MVHALLVNGGIGDNGNLLPVDRSVFLLNARKEREFPKSSDLRSLRVKALPCSEHTEKKRNLTGSETRVSVHRYGTFILCVKCVCLVKQFQEQVAVYI